MISSCIYSKTLVAKKQLHHALWAVANVIDSALAQALPELREALGDDGVTLTMS